MVMRLNIGDLLVVGIGVAACPVVTPQKATKLQLKIWFKFCLHNEGRI